MAAIAGLTVLGKIAAAASAAGTLLSTAGAMTAARTQEKTAQFNAAQIEAKGKAEQAQSTHEAENERRRKELMLSRARAVGAASGGGIDLNLMGDIEEEGTLNEQRILWSGNEARKGRFDQAAAIRTEGKAKKRAGMFDAGTTLLSGGKSFIEKYG